MSSPRFGTASRVMDGIREWTCRFRVEAMGTRTSWWCVGSTDLSKTRERGAGRSLPRQSVCTVNWQRIGGLACNSTGKLSAFQTSLYAGRTHTSRPSRSLPPSPHRASRSVTPAALKASTSYPYFSTRIIILTALTRLNHVWGTRFWSCVCVFRLMRTTRS